MDNYHALFQEYRRQYEENIRSEKQLKAEINNLKGDLNNCRSSYYAMKMKNDEVQKSIDLELKIGNKLSDKLFDLLDAHRKDCDDVNSEMENVLQNFNVEKEVERRMIFQTYQAVKNIPKTFSAEVVLKKTEVVDDMIEKITEEIEVETERLVHMKEIYIAENTDERDAHLAKFITELKTINIKLNLSTPRH